MRAPVALRSTIRARRTPTHAAQRADTGMFTDWRRASVSRKCAIKRRRRSAVPASASVPPRTLRISDAAASTCVAISRVASAFASATSRTGCIRLPSARVPSVADCVETAIAST